MENKELKQSQQAIRIQWDEMIAEGIIPLVEFQTGENDWLLVDVELSSDNTAFIFSFDKDPLCDTSFSGDVIHVCYNYQLPIDEYCDNLDLYIVKINEEMLEGYILPNNLYYCEG